MRLSPVLAVSGALLAALVSTPAWAADPTPTASAPAPTASPTPAPVTPSVPVTPPAAGPPPATKVSGSLRLSARSGPVGTKISVTPSAPCVATDGTVVPLADVILMTKAHFDSPKPFDPDAERLVDTDGSGAWTTTLTVPASAKAGVTYVVAAICITSTKDDATAVRVYKPVTFVVSASKAPVATPVPGTPKFTG